jgi:hypothetical protein
MPTTSLPRWIALTTGGFAATTLLGSVATPHAETDVAARLEALSHYSVIGNVTYLCRMASAVLLAPLLVTAMHALHGRGTRLGVTGATLLILGHVAGAGAVTIMAVQINVLATAPDRPAAVEITTQLDHSLLWQIICVFYLAGWILGFLLLGIALWRARALPRWAAASISLGPLLHIAVGDLRWTAVGGAVVLTAGLAMLTITALHPTEPPSRPTTRRPRPTTPAELMLSPDETQPTT